MRVEEKPGIPYDVLVANFAKKYTSDCFDFNSVKINVKNISK